MGRGFYLPVNISAHTAQVDLFEILAATDKPVELVSWELAYTSETGEAQEEWLTAVLKRITGAPTSGSGGSSPTPTPVLPNSAAAGLTAELGNTTKLTGGTSAEVSRHPVNVRAEKLFIPVPEGRVAIAPGTRLVLEEVVTPADSVTGPAGWILVEETL